MNFLEELQQAWQSQCSKSLDVNPDQLLFLVRLEKRVNLWADTFVVLVLLGCGGGMFWWALQDIQQDWPWLFYSACLAWVVGYILFDRWRRRRDVAHYDEPLLAHVEWAIKEVEHQKWLSGNTLWWYILPISLGCMIPPAFSFAMEFGKRPLWGDLIALLGAEAFFVATFIFVYLVMRHGRRIGLEKSRQKLEALRALRETLLNTEE